MRHLAALGESPVTQKMGTARYSHRFRSPSLFETTHFDERKSDGSPHFCPHPLLWRTVKPRPSRPDGDGQLMTQAIWHRKHHDHTVAQRHAVGNPNVDLVQAGEPWSQS